MKLAIRNAIRAAAIAAALCVLAPLTYADDRSALPAPTAEVTRPKIQPNEADLKEHGHYVNKRGATVHSPAHTRSGAIPDGASAQCRDGTYSFSQHRSGTCSHHGGVAHWANQ